MKYWRYALIKTLTSLIYLLMGNCCKFFFSLLYFLLHAILWSNLCHWDYILGLEFRILSRPLVFLLSLTSCFLGISGLRGLDLCRGEAVTYVHWGRLYVYGRKILILRKRKRKNLVKISRVEGGWGCVIPEWRYMCKLVRSWHPMLQFFLKSRRTWISMLSTKHIMLQAVLEHKCKIPLVLKPLQSERLRSTAL